MRVHCPPHTSCDQRYNESEEHDRQSSLSRRADLQRPHSWDRNNQNHDIEDNIWQREAAVEESEIDTLTLLLYCHSPESSDRTTHDDGGNFISDANEDGRSEDDPGDETCARASEDPEV